MRCVKMLFVTLLIMVGSASGVLAGDYPDRPLKMVVGFRAGGTVDTMARVLAKNAGEILGQPIIIMNKPGGGATVAASYMASVAPDGYTMCASIDPPYDFAPLAQKTIRYKLDDFKFLGIYGQFQPAFVAKADSPYNSFKEIVDAAKAGKTLRYGSMAPEEKIPMMAFARKNKLRLMPVPTKGGSAIMTAVLGGHVDYGYSGGLHYSYVKAGKMKILASAGRERLIAFPDVPTLQEQGVPIDGTTKMVVLVPQGVSAERAKILEGALRQAANTKEYKELLENKLHFRFEWADADTAQKFIEDRYDYFKNTGF